MLEVAADAPATLDEHVASEQDRGEHPLAHGGLGVDVLGDQRPEHERALGMADQDEAAPVVVLAQVGRERGSDVVQRTRERPSMFVLPSWLRVSCRYIGAYTWQYCE